MSKQTNLILLFIIIQPLIDLVTSLTVDMFSISLGALLRTLLMSFLLLYNFIYLFKKRSQMTWFYLASLMTIGCTLVMNFILKQPFYLYEEINFALKTSYYVVMIYTIIIFLENKFIQQALIFRAVKFISIIIGGSYWFAIFTKTGMSSYTYIKAGYVGWFYAANELSVTVIILLALTMINLRYEQTITAWSAFILMMSLTPMIGTKTAFAGGLMIILFYTIYLLFPFGKIRPMDHWLFFGIVFVFICFIPFSPMSTHSPHLSSESAQISQSIETEAAKDQSPLPGNILSSRNIYFQDIKEDFMSAKTIRKAFGLGYAGDYSEEPKIIEMDFFDLFFSYGIIGTTLLLLPLIFLCIKVISFPLSIEKVTLLLTIGLCFGISLLAGHILFAPSVMTYVSLLFLTLGLYNHGGLPDGR